MFGPTWSILVGDAKTRLAGIGSGEVACCVTSPPYWGQRLYNGEMTIGNESTLEGYIDSLVSIFAAARKCMRKDGTLWLNLGDSFFNKQNSNRNGSTKSLGGNSTRGGGEYVTQRRSSKTLKEKDLCGVPWRVAFALQADGWYLRDAIIWHKPSPMPGGARDRCTFAYEMVFMLAVSPKYKFNWEAIAEDAVSLPGQKRYRRNVWTIPSARGNGWHFALMPKRLAEICITAGSDENDLVLDPFHGSGTTGRAAIGLGRRYVGIELVEDFAEESELQFRREFDYETSSTGNVL